MACLSAPIPAAVRRAPMPTTLRVTLPAAAAPMRLAPSTATPRSATAQMRADPDSRPTLRSAAMQMHTHLILLWGANIAIGGAETRGSWTAANALGNQSANIATRRRAMAAVRDFGRDPSGSARNPGAVPREKVTASGRNSGGRRPRRPCKAAPPHLGLAPIHQDVAPAATPPMARLPDWQMALAKAQPCNAVLSSPLKGRVSEGWPSGLRHRS
jgi:hypothetical protein